MTYAPRARRASAPLLGLVAAVALLAGGCGERSDQVPSTVSDTASPASVRQIPDGKFRTMAQTSFIRSWDLDLQSKVEHSWISPNAPDLLFFQTARDHAIVAVDAMSGATRWMTIPLPRAMRLPPFVASTPLRENGQIVYDRRLYLVSDDLLFCFDVGSGQVVWRMLLPFAPASGPWATGTETDLRLFIGDTEGRVRVISQLAGGGTPYEVWQWNLQTDLSAQPVGFEGLVYVGDHQGVMHCFALDREQRWGFPGGGLILGSGAIRDRVLYFGNTDNILYAINRLTGERYGQLNLNGHIGRTPFFYAGEPHRLYLWVNHEDPRVAGIYAIRAEPSTISFAENTSDHPHPPMEIVRLGEEWHFPGASRLIGSTPQHLFLTYPHSDVLLAVRRDSGDLEWAWDVNEGRPKDHLVTGITEYQDPTDTNRSVYTYDDRGQVVAFRYFGYVPPSKDAPPPMLGLGDEELSSSPKAHPKKDAAGAGGDAKPAGDAGGDAKPAGDSGGDTGK